MSPALGWGGRSLRRSRFGRRQAGEGGFDLFQLDVPWGELPRDAGEEPVPDFALGVPFHQLVEVVLSATLFPQRELPLFQLAAVRAVHLPRIPRGPDEVPARLSVPEARGGARCRRLGSAR